MPVKLTKAQLKPCVVGIPMERIKLDLIRRPMQVKH